MASAFIYNRPVVRALAQAVVHLNSFPSSASWDFKLQSGVWTHVHLELFEKRNDSKGQQLLNSTCYA